MAETFLFAVTLILGTAFLLSMVLEEVFRVIQGEWRPSSGTLTSLPAISESQRRRMLELDPASGAAFFASLIPHEPSPLPDDDRSRSAA